jgi:uracil-DNA glycosylase family 4
MTCDTCPHRKGQCINRPANPQRKKMIVVGDAPTIYEIRANDYFQGQIGNLLRVCLKQLGANLDDIWFTGVTGCMNSDRSKPTPADAIAACRERLLSEIPEGSRILICGSSPLEALAPQFGKIRSARGLMVDLPELGSVATLTYHPAMIFNDTFFFTDFINDLRKFISRDRPYQVNLPKTVLCSSVREIQRAVMKLRRSYLIFVDLETTSLDPLCGEIVLMGLQGDDDEAFHIPGLMLDRPYVRRIVKSLLEDRSIPSAAHNIGFDTKWVKSKLGIDWRPTIDTMLLHYTLDERSKDEDDSKGNSNRGGLVGVHGLKTLVQARYDVPDYSKPLDDYLKDLTKTRRSLKDAREVNYGDVPLEILSPYLTHDLYFTRLLARDLYEEAQEEGVAKVHDNILIPAALALRDVELTGVLIDQQVLLDAKVKFEAEAEECLRQLREITGVDDFNPNSPKQVAELLYDNLKLPQIKGKGRSTDQETMDQLAKSHPAVKLITDARQKTKMIGTYVTGILNRISEDGRLRGEFLLHGTQTGRLSSRNPNLQNIPVLIGPLIRNAFIASPGYTLIEADYSQLELRVAALFSGDEKMIDSYRRGIDIHRVVASEVFHVPPEQVTQMQRYIAKYIDFGILYGRQAHSLAANELQCSVEEAQGYIDSFLGRFQGLSKWMKETQRKSLQQGYVESKFGRRRRFPLILESNRGDIERKSVNTPIQSTASDLCLTALTRINSRFQKTGHGRVLLTVHDSILIEAKNEYLDDALAVVHDEMETHTLPDSPVPFVVDVKVGQSWGKLDKRNNS